MVTYINPSLCQLARLWWLTDTVPWLSLNIFPWQTHPSSAGTWSSFWADCKTLTSKKNTEQREVVTQAGVAWGVWDRTREVDISELCPFVGWFDVEDWDRMVRIFRESVVFQEDEYSSNVPGTLRKGGVQRRKAAWALCRDNEARLSELLSRWRADGKFDRRNLLLYSANSY